MARRASCGSVDRPAGTTVAPQPNRRRPIVSCMLMLAASAALIAVACARETRHEILVFFYDGVPPLDAGIDRASEMSSDVSGEKDGPRVKRKTTFYTHPLHLQNRCPDCHKEDRVLQISVRDGLCRLCHFDKPEDKETMTFLHGPFAVNACLSCHRMHKSRHKGILLADAQDVCFFCHEMGNLVLGAHHESIETKRCIECHSPHGGSDRYFLLPEVAQASAEGSATAIDGE